jgi:hypothetical protein
MIPLKRAYEAASEGAGGEDRPVAEGPCRCPERRRPFLTYLTEGMNRLTVRHALRYTHSFCSRRALGRPALPPAPGVRRMARRVVRLPPVDRADVPIHQRTNSSGPHGGQPCGTMRCGWAKDS